MEKQKSDTKLINEKLLFIAEIGRISAWITNRYTVFLKPYGISPQQFNILRVLRTEGDWLPMHTINELLINKSPNITRLVDKLLSKELVERNRSEKDRRIVYAKITEKGVSLLALLDEKHEGELSDYMNNFTVEEAVMMRDILQRIRE